MDFGAKFMVRSPYSREGTNQMSNKTKKKDNQKQSLFWEAEKKRPSKFLFITLIAVTIIILLYGVVDNIMSFHEIKIVIDCDEDYRGNIRFSGSFESFDRDSGLREFSFEIREGIAVKIYVYKYDSDMDFMTISVYDNGKLVLQRTPHENERMINMEFKVGTGIK